MTKRLMTPEEARQAEQTPLLPVNLIAALLGIPVGTGLEFGREPEAS